MNYITRQEALETVARSLGLTSRKALIGNELNPGSPDGNSTRLRCTLACLVELTSLAQKISHKKTHQMIKQN